jgi:hypothetical protein
MTFLKTQSVGVKRLSLVGGLIAAIYHIATLNEPFGPPAQDPGHPWQNLAINLGNLIIECALFFLVAWGLIRVIAWIANGFVSDNSKSKQE